MSIRIIYFFEAKNERREKERRKVKREKAIGGEKEKEKEENNRWLWETLNCVSPKKT